MKIALLFLVATLSAWAVPPNPFAEILANLAEDKTVSDPVKAKRVTELVEALDSPRYRVRAAAEQELIGLDVQTLLTTAFQDAVVAPQSEEVRWRAERIRKALTIRNSPYSELELTNAVRERILDRVHKAAPAEVRARLTALGDKFTTTHEKRLAGLPVEERARGYADALVKLFSAEGRVEHRGWSSQPGDAFLLILQLRDETSAMTFHLTFRTESEIILLPPFVRATEWTFTDADIQAFRNAKPNLRPGLVFPANIRWDRLKHCRFVAAIEYSANGTKVPRVGVKSTANGPEDLDLNLELFEREELPQRERD